MDITQFYLALVVGLVLGLLVEELLGITCGGVIVCGYLSMLCDDLLSIVLVILIAMITFLIVEFILPKFVIIFGKRRFVACLIVSLILKLLADFFVPMLPFATLAFRGAGVITPGLIANTCSKQGVHITIPSVLIGTYVTFLIVQLLMVVI